MPVFDMIETLMVKKLHFRPSWFLRFIVRNVYVGKQNPLLIKYCMPKNQVTSSVCFVISAFTMFVAITFPFFGGLLGFFGGFAFAPTTYFVRPIHPLKTKIMLHTLSFYSFSIS
jgi:hypothetical protein